MWAGSGCSMHHDRNNTGTLIRKNDTGSTNYNETDISALQSKPDKFSQFFNAWNDRHGHTGLVLNKNLQASCGWSTKSHKLTRNHPIQVSIFYLPGIQLIDWLSICKPFAQGLTGVSISLKYYWWCFKRTLILALGKVLQCKLLRPFLWKSALPKLSVMNWWTCDFHPKKKTQWCVCFQSTR
jgi:hypothetical protein